MGNLVIGLTSLVLSLVGFAATIIVGFWAYTTLDAPQWVWTLWVISMVSIVFSHGLQLIKFD